MRKVLLQRFQTTVKQTLGILFFIKGDGQLFVCKTLELPWLNNQRNISCIPPGIYTCEWNYSPKFQKETYEIRNVPDRTGIRIHSANFYYSLLGCIALGDAHKDINADGQKDVIHSGDTLKLFEQEMNQESFQLEIRADYNSIV